MRRPVLFAILLTLAFAVPTVLIPAAQANHITRIVMPYGQHEREIAIVAGYEVSPRPLGCDAGTIIPSTVFYSQDFESNSNGLTILSNSNKIHYPATGVRNLWHVTHSVTNEKGTNDGHSGTGRLYFGNDATGLMRSSFYRLAGTANFPAFTVPTEPSFISWKDKFEVEGLFGYDHLWVEVVDVNTGTIYILCSTDTDVRPDKTSTDNEFSTCSPYRTMLCPTGIHGHGGMNSIGCIPPWINFCIPTGLGWLDFGALGLQRIDPTAPHWEDRYVRLPAELIGKTVAPRFHFESADGVANGYLGWMGDDILIATGTPVPEPYAYVAPVPSP